MASSLKLYHDQRAYRSVSLDTSTLDPDDVASGVKSCTVQPSDLPLTNTVVVTATGGGLTVAGSASAVVIVSEAPTSTGIVSGTVVSADSTGIAGTQANQEDAGIEGAQVTLSNESADEASSAVVVIRAALLRTESTDAEGVYLFDAVPVGTYALTVTKDATTVVGTVVLQEESSSTALYLPAVSSNSAAAASAARVAERRQLFLSAVVR